METLEVKRKNIDIPVNIFRNLSMRAAAEGSSLKKFIENLLVIEANSMTDEEIYTNLVFACPDGNVSLNKEEQTDFENWLGV